MTKTISIVALLENGIMEALGCTRPEAHSYLTPQVMTEMVKQSQEFDIQYSKDNPNSDDTYGDGIFDLYHKAGIRIANNQFL